MAATSLELVRCDAASEVADDGRPCHDGRERHIESKDRNEGRSRNSPQQIVLERSRADAMGRLKHDGRYGGLDAIE